MSLVRRPPGPPRSSVCGIPVCFGRDAARRACGLLVGLVQPCADASGLPRWGRGCRAPRGASALGPFRGLSGAGPAGSGGGLCTCCKDAFSGRCPAAFPPAQGPRVLAGAADLRALRGRRPAGWGLPAHRGACARASWPVAGGVLSGACRPPVPLPRGNVCSFCSFFTQLLGFVVDVPLTFKSGSVMLLALVKPEVINRSTACGARSLSGFCARERERGGQHPALLKPWFKC